MVIWGALYRRLGWFDVGRDMWKLEGEAQLTAGVKQMSLAYS